MELNETNNRSLKKIQETNEHVSKNVNSTDSLTESFTQFQDITSRLRDGVAMVLSVSDNVKQKSETVEYSTNELAAIIEEASASLQEMSATKETLSSDNEHIAEIVANTNTKLQHILIIPTPHLSIEMGCFMSQKIYCYLYLNSPLLSKISVSQRSNLGYGSISCFSPWDSFLL